jgi:hypothetical protein
MVTDLGVRHLWNITVEMVRKWQIVMDGEGMVSDEDCTEAGAFAECF